MADKFSFDKSFRGPIKMSSRALRRAQKNKAIEEINNSEEEEIFESRPNNKNIFQQVNIDFWDVIY